MAEQEKQGQNQPAVEEAGNADERASGTGEGNQGQGAVGGGDDSSRGSDNPEQTGEGTGAKAGEYS